MDWSNMLDSYYDKGYLMYIIYGIIALILYFLYFWWLK